MRNRELIAGALLFVAVFLATLIGPSVYRADPNEIRLQTPLAAPGRDAPAGRDALGRDLLSRCLVASRTSFAVAFGAVAMAILAGCVVGALAGYIGGTADALLMRLTDIVLAFPGFLLALVFAAALGASRWNIAFALGATGWTAYARLVRAEVLSLRERDFVVAAGALGAPLWRVIWKHLLPQIRGAVTVQAVFGLSSAILAEASLSFLGLGAQPPAASWGVMLNDARPFLLMAPHLAIVPGVALTLTVLALVLIAEGLHGPDDFDNSPS
jgi:peptide/nickel transport system permease protein